MAWNDMRRSAFAILGIVAAAGACTWGHQDPQRSVHRPLVFPGEARLGATAFMVVDSNYMEVDDLERYDLDRSRVQIQMEGDSGPVAVHLRSVFAVESGGATQNAVVRPGVWTMVALFDLPDENEIDLAPPFPRLVPLDLYIDGNEVTAMQGVVSVLGTGGQPTDLDATPLLPLLETELEPSTMVRLRAKDAGAEGFSDQWTIGALQAEIRFDTTCLASPRARTGSDAVGGGAFLGVETPVSGSIDSVELFLTHAGGFQLPLEGISDPTRLGQGPILDIVFDRIQDPMCSGSLDQYFGIYGLLVTDLDGSTYLSRAPGADSSDLFHISYVDPEPPL